MKSESRFNWPGLRTLFLFAGPLPALAICLVADFGHGSNHAADVAAIAVWMAIWWMSECVPLPVTSLLPLVLLPALGVMPTDLVAGEYFNSTVLLFLGGFLLAAALQRWNVHKRIALAILAVSGTRPSMLLLGFMAATAFVSWWVNNTATTMMMLPIALAIVLHLERTAGPEIAGFNKAILLASAYASSIGGIATPVGTPTNLILIRQYELLFPDQPPLTFAKWMLFFVPVSAILLLLGWILLSKVFIHPSSRLPNDLIMEQRKELGPIGREELATLLLFLAAVLLWITRSPIDFGSLMLPGWGRLFVSSDGTSLVDDGTIAIGVAILLFLIPGRKEGCRTLLHWEDTRDLPWGTILLFGGGFALAEAFQVAGLTSWFSQQLHGLSGMPPWLLIPAIYFLVTTLSEFASNTASAQLVLPIVGAAAVSMGLPPLLPMLTAATGTSLDFVLPAATPPNALVVATGRISAREMLRVGTMMELICAIVVSVAIWALGGWVGA